jgi:indole-3-glycerol phosphate synthase
MSPSSLSSTYLAGIVAWHRARAAADERDLATLADLARTKVGSGALADRVRPFTESLRQGDGPTIIAEVKRRSPSKGDLAMDLDPAGLAADYERGGAACLSVLTDAQHFSGSPADLAAARAATSIPVLRKDFTVAEADLYDARLMGADAVLLIVAALDDTELARFIHLAGSLQLAAVVEVHDRAEAVRAVAAGAEVIGVNQRDLRTFEVDTARAEHVAAELPASVVKVAESGITSRSDVVRLGNAGYDAVLVGEAFVRSRDRVEAVRALRGAPPGAGGAGGASGAGMSRNGASEVPASEVPA